ncbi:unknown [Clostridium sp. CAG:505]|nr:unknown [Clostridium sp. CAG:505]
MRCFTGRKQVYAFIRGNRPVIVLAAAVDTSKGFFMKQTNQTMSCRNFLHNFHCQLVVICCDVCCCIDGRQFMLCRSHFVVFRLCQYAKLPQFFIQIFHKSGYRRFDGTKIVIIQFLTFRRLCTKQSPSSKNQVTTFFIHFSVYQKIFLLRPHRSTDAFHMVIAKQTQDTQRLTVQCLHGSEQWCFLIQRFPCIRTKCSGNTQGFSFDECIGCRIPCGISSCLKCGTQSS